MDLGAGPADFLTQDQVNQILEGKTKVIGTPQVAKDTQGIILKPDIGEIDRGRFADLAADIAEKGSDSLEDIGLFRIPAIVLYGRL